MPQLVLCFSTPQARRDVAQSATAASSTPLGRVIFSAAHCVPLLLSEVVLRRALQTAMLLFEPFFTSKHYGRAIDVALSGDINIWLASTQKKNRTKKKNTPRLSS